MTHTRLSGIATKNGVDMDARIDFKEVISLVNKTGFTNIAESPLERTEGKWAIYKGENRVPGFTYSFKILYLYSDATKESIEDVAATGRADAETQVVYAPSLDKHADFIKKIFARKARVVWSVKEYLKEFIREKLNIYLDKIKTIAPLYYIDPQIITPSTFKIKHGNPLRNFFTDDNTIGTVAILKAAPGQGKTYQAQYVASALSDSSVIPIYIHSQQWSSIRQEELQSVWATLLNCFKYFETPFVWTDGAEEDFLRLSLKLGIFAIIFDGFDEYILWNKGQISATDTLSTIIELATATGAKVLLTTRSSFWKSEIEGKFEEDISSSIFEYSLKPFDINQARDYFKKRFPESEDSANSATIVFSELLNKYSKNTDDNPVGRGFFLNLIADLVKRSDGKPYSLEGQDSPSLWLVKSLCEREETRQKLEISSSEQLAIFKLFAQLIFSDHEPTTATLRFAIDFFAEDFNLGPQEIESLIGDSGKLKDHPIIQRHAKDDLWTFTEEQIAFNLVADTLLSLAFDRKIKNRSSALRAVLLDILKSRSTQSNSVYLRASNVAGTIIDQLLYKHHGDQFRFAVKEFIDALREIPPTQSNDKSFLNEESLLISSIAQLAVDEIKRLGSSATERRDEFLFYVGTEQTINNVHFFGTIQSMSFFNVTFKRCKFMNVVWSSCKFDETTKFHDCHFSGGACHNCQGLGKAEWSLLSTDKEGNHFINLEKIKSNSKQYSANDLRQDINYMIRKLIPKEGCGLKSISTSDMLKGVISSSQHKKEILDGLCRFVLEKHHLSGTSDSGFHIRDIAKESVLFFAVNGVYVGALEEAYQFILKSLRIPAS